MNIQEYRTHLQSLPICNPKPEDMVRLCPHLTPEQAITAFSSNGYVACPPLKVADAFQVLHLYGEHVEKIKEWQGDEHVVVDTKTHPPFLVIAYSGRKNDRLANCPHIDEAIDYAQANWGNELVDDTWVDAIQYHIQDPRVLGTQGVFGKGSPTTKMTLYVCLSRRLNEILNDPARPTSQLYDAAIVEMSLDRAIWSELKGGRGGYSYFNCANCGSGLDLNRCTGCGITYRDNEFRMGCGTPLSPKMVEFVRASGYVFDTDPQVALQAEAEEHEALLQIWAQRQEQTALASSPSPSLNW